MSLRVIGGIGIIGLVIGATIAIDALVVTDEELLEQFIRDVTGKVDRDYVFRCLGYVQLEQTPLDVEVMLPVESHTGVYDASRAQELESKFRSYIRPYYGDTVRAIQKKIKVEGDRAEVGFTVFSRRLRVRVECKMRKIDDRWLVAAVHIHR